jgi:hypothetical protein
MRIPTRIAAVWLSVAVVLCGCGSGQSPGGAGPSPPSAAAKKPPNQADTLSLKMVSAVPANKSSTAPVQVKFALRERPQVAQPLEIDLAIVPVSGSVDRVSGKVVTDDGLELVDGGEIPPVERPAEGVPIAHTVKVLPQRDGIFTFSAVVTVYSGGTSSTQTFSVPVIAGAGLPDLPAKSPAPPPPRPSRSAALQ